MLSPTFFSSGFILMILKSCSSPGSRVTGWPLRIDRFGVVAEAFECLGDLDERAEAGYPQDFSVHHVTDVMLFEEVSQTSG